MSQRLRRFAAHPRILIEMAKAIHPGVRIRAMSNALPPDAEYVGATFDPERRVVWVFVESEAFDLIEEGGVVPEHPRTLYEKIYD